MKRAPLLLPVLLAVSAAHVSTAHAQAGLRVHQIDNIRVDGSIRDWRGAHFAEVGRGNDASMRFAVGSDSRGLYIAAEVRDDRIVRTPSPGAREDAVILTLSIPRGRRRSISEIYLYAGVSGRSAGSAGLASGLGGRPHALSGARVVEGPRRRGRGYVIEAFIPFSRIPNGSRWQDARGTIRLRDVDRETHAEVESEPAYVPTDALVPLLPAGGARGALSQFLTQQGIEAARPRFDLRGNVAGDRRPEQVFLVERFVVVTGEGYRDGGYTYHELPVRSADDIRSAELRDLTGDRIAELITVLRQRNDQGERDLWRVYSLSGESPQPIFAIEVRKAVGRGSIEARVRVHRGRGRRPAEIEVSTHRAQRIDQSTYRERPANDAESILVPWGPILSRRYRWQEGEFARVSERPNPRYEPPAEPATATVRGRRGTTRAAPPAPVAPTQDALLAAFRRERHIGRGARPDHRFSTNFAGGREPETALVFGRHLVIVGSGIQNGTSWFYYEIPAPSDDDLVNVRAADVTGDRRSEFLFRVRQRFGEVTREILVVHQLTPRGFPRILEVEVSRTQGSNSISNQVRARRGRLEIRPGRARGWSAETWRFTRDPNDSAQPLLLPWQDSAVRYRLRRGRLTP